MASSPCSSSSTKPKRFFKIVLSDIGSHSSLMIPRKFASLYEMNLSDRIFLKAPSGLIWSIGLERHGHRICLQNGWPEFANFYTISFGHMLVFEYQGDSRFLVRIFDPSASEIDYPLTSSKNPNSVISMSQVKKRIIDIYDSTSSDMKRPSKKIRASSAPIAASNTGPKLQHEKAKGNGESPRNEDKDRALASAKAFKSKNPVFIHAMKPFYVYENGSGVYIPRTFTEAYKKWKCHNQIILQVAGRTWPVTCTLYSNCNQCRIRQGWARFARDNSLNEGDACVFELINPSRKLLQVLMFRATNEAGISGVLASSEVLVSKYPRS